MHKGNKQALTRLLKDPLSYFLLGGFIIFVVALANQSDVEQNQNPNHIRVDRPALIETLQTMNNKVPSAQVIKQLDSLPKQYLESLVKQHVEYEVLYREATKLGFGENDYIIKKRMIQKLDYIVENISKASIDSTDKDIEHYYQTYQSEFIQPAQYSFTHVFIDADKHLDNPELLNKLSDKLYKQLNEQKVSLSDANNYGDRFAFDDEYTRATSAELELYFGKDMVEKLITIEPNPALWQGPYTSIYGKHLILLTEKIEETLIPMEESKDSILAELHQIKLAQARVKLIDELVASYSIETKEPLPSLAELNLTTHHNKPESQLKFKDKFLDAKEVFIDDGAVIEQ